MTAPTSAPAGPTSAPAAASTESGAAKATEKRPVQAGEAILGEREDSSLEHRRRGISAPGKRPEGAGCAEAHAGERKDFRRGLADGTTLRTHRCSADGETMRGIRFQEESHIGVDPLLDQVMELLLDFR